MLASGYFKIPRFQRPYSWDRENIQDFWDDVIKDSPVDYFIGSMVVYKVGSQRYGVVDGQQRLTTITILLCVLRNALNKAGETELATGIHGLIERRNIDNELEFVVSTETSYPFFQDRIQKFGPSELEVEAQSEEHNLQAAFDQLTALVEGVVSSIENDSSLSHKKQASAVRSKLLAFRDALLELKLILIRLDTEDDAYIIFETLNSRGKDLSLTDLVKNHLVKHLKKKSAAPDSARLKWEQVLEIIEGSSVDLDMDTFLHHAWLSKYEYLPAKTLFKRLKKQIGSAGKASEFLDALLVDASLYRGAQEQGFWKWSKQERSLADALSALTIFRVQQPAPCVLSVLREYHETKKIRRRHIEEALVAIEKFHFLSTAIASQPSSGGISAMYAALARRLHEASDTSAAYKVIKELRAKLKDRVPTLGEFEALFPLVTYTDNVTKQKRLVKYVLSKLYASSHPAAVVDYDMMTIEHLAPQSAIGKGAFTDAIIGQFGNLLLVPEDLNRALKDASFTDKKSALLKAGYALPADIKAAKTWEAAQIQSRTASLATLAYNTVWKI